LKPFSSAVFQYYRIGVVDSEYGVIFPENQVFRVENGFFRAENKPYKNCIKNAAGWGVSL
jgi:hypothetical protein